MLMNIHEFLVLPSTGTEVIMKSLSINNPICRGDSMILTFHVPLLAMGQGICDIDRV